MPCIFRVAFLTVGLAAGLTACSGPVVKKPPVASDKPDGTQAAPEKGDKAAGDAPATDNGDKPADPPKGW